MIFRSLQGGKFETTTKEDKVINILKEHKPSHTVLIIDDTNPEQVKHACLECTEKLAKLVK